MFLRVQSDFQLYLTKTPLLVTLSNILVVLFLLVVCLTQKKERVLLFKGGILGRRASLYCWYHTLRTGGDDGSASISTRDGSSSPTSLASAGTTSLQQDEDSLEGSASKEGDKSKLFEQSCQELVSIIEELQWQHAQVHVT